MSEESPNFGHLNEIDRPLAVLGSHAERYFVDDANTALIKTRQFAERMARVIAERSGVSLEGQGTFVDTLRVIRRDGLVPNEILDVLHQLRIDGNNAVHGHDGERRHAFESIKLCHRLGVWLRASVQRSPKLTMAFVPPRLAASDPADLRRQVEELKTELQKRSEDTQRLLAEAEEARSRALDSEARRRLAEEERAVFEELAEDAEKRLAASVSKDGSLSFLRAAFESAKNIDFDEGDTRLLIDEQLRQAGWEADSSSLRHASGTRPERGRNKAIAEWPTKSGPADYALFIGRTLVGLVEAKRKRKNVMSALDVQATRYSKDIQHSADFEFAGGPWAEHRAPFIFAANGRSYYPAMHTQSGIWFRDTRIDTNAARPLEGWISPKGLSERLEIDRVAAERSLAERPFNFGFDLRPYQISAIQAVEEGLRQGRREMLLAMATGTGKTKLAIAMIYRLLEAKRFLRVCFVVDRSALGEQAESAFETTRVVGAKCPSSDDLGHEGLSRNGGSGSLVVQSMPPSDGAASGASRWSSP